MFLREAVPDDVPAIIEVQRPAAVRALAHIFPQDVHPFPEAAIRARWLAEIADPQIAVSVIELDGRVAGFAATRDNELLHFGTAMETWGTGLAVRAHDEIVSRFVALGASRARLRVFEENHRARRFYEKLGWRGTGERSRTTFAPYPVMLEYERDL
jgi:RimJ/RimL family protein N-acetyltransferase